MRKLLAVGTMLVLMLALAAPAFAQDAVADDGAIAEGGDVLFLDASQAQFAGQISTGDATATADDGSAAFASNSAFVFQTQVNAGLGTNFFFVY